MTFLLWFLLAYAAAVGAALLLWIAIKRRRSRRSWRQWHQVQSSRLFAWRVLFGREHHKRLTYAPADPGESVHPPL